MGIVRHVVVLAVAAASVAACTWGTYDPSGDGGLGNDSGLVNDAGGVGVQVDPQAGGTVTSSDGVFEIDLPSGVLNTPAYVRIIPASTQGKFGTGQVFGFDYAVSFVGTIKNGPTVQLLHPVSVVFHLATSKFNIPPEELFIVTEGSGGGTLPGAFASSPGSDVYAVQVAPSGTVQTLGPYLAVHGSVGPSAGACNCNAQCGNNCVCGNCGCASTLASIAQFDGCYAACQGGPQDDVCSPCLRKCWSVGTALTSPKPSNGVLTRSCYGASTAPGVVACMLTCVEGAQGSQCQ